MSFLSFWFFLSTLKSTACMLFMQRSSSDMQTSFDLCVSQVFGFLLFALYNFLPMTGGLMKVAVLMCFSYSLKSCIHLPSILGTKTKRL